MWAGSSGRKKIEGKNNKHKVDIVRTQRKIDFMRNSKGHLIEKWK